MYANELVEWKNTKPDHATILLDTKSITKTRYFEENDRTLESVPDVRRFKTGNVIHNENQQEFDLVFP